MEIDVLKVLDEMDEFRRKHYFDKQPTPDFYMRALEAILARAAGYNGRAEWTAKLKETSSRYKRDLQEIEKWGTF